MIAYVFVHNNIFSNIKKRNQEIFSNRDSGSINSLRCSLNQDLTKDSEFKYSKYIFQILKQILSFLLRKMNKNTRKE